MDPLGFDKMSTEKLKAETHRYRLPSTDDRNQMIEQLLAHYESNSPALLNQRQASQAQEKHAGVAMNALATAITTQMQQMQQAMLQQHLQQQKLLRQMLQLLTRNQQQDRPTQGPSYQSRPPRSEAPSPSSQGQSYHSAITAAPSTHAVSMLASQIPEFGGQEDENVELWVKRVEQVSRIHGAHEDITFLASTTRLVKTARRWYDLGSGSMLESWTGFRDAILKRFTRKVLYHLAMQKAEARRWNYARESFLEYAIDKLTLIHNLDLSPDSTIHLLISGIDSRSLREIATSLKNDSVDHFLESMHQVFVCHFNLILFVPGLCGKPYD